MAWKTIWWWNIIVLRSGLQWSFFLSLHSLIWMCIHRMSTFVSLLHQLTIQSTLAPFVRVKLRYRIKSEGRGQWGVQWASACWSLHQGYKLAGNWPWPGVLQTERTTKKGKAVIYPAFQELQVLMTLKVHCVVMLPVATHEKYYLYIRTAFQRLLFILMDVECCVRAFQCFLSPGQGTTGGNELVAQSGI